MNRSEFYIKEVRRKYQEAKISRYREDRNSAFIEASAHAAMATMEVLIESSKEN